MEMTLRCICGKTYNLRARLPLDGILNVPGNTSFLHFPNSFGKFVWLLPGMLQKSSFGSGRRRTPRRYRLS